MEDVSKCMKISCKTPITELFSMRNFFMNHTLKSLVNQHNHDSDENEEDDHERNVNTYDTFMKKHLSNYGYYGCNGK